MSGPRLTGGHARGRIVVGEAPPGVRPTSSRVREALFSIVGNDLTGARVLDAFGGTGTLAFEAWSRGAEVTLVEQVGANVKAIRLSADKLGARLDLRTGDVLRLAPSLGTFDLVLVDPPYALDPAPILAALAPLVGGALVLEADVKTRPPGAVGGLTAEPPRAYGGTNLWVYRLAAPADPA